MLLRSRSSAPVLALVAALLAGCGGDGDVPNEAPIGNVERTGEITVANLAVVVDGSGSGVLVGTIVNDGESADTLVGVSLEGPTGEPVPVEVTGGAVELPVDEPVQLAVRAGEAPLVVLTSDDLRPGFRAPIVLEFDEAPAITDTVGIESATEAYADVEVP